MTDEELDALVYGLQMMLEDYSEASIYDDYPKILRDSITALRARADQAEAALAEARAQALRDAADADWSTGKDTPDDAPEYLSDWHRGFVAGINAKRDAILAMIEGGK